MPMASLALESDDKIRIEQSRLIEPALGLVGKSRGVRADSKTLTSGAPSSYNLGVRQPIGSSSHLYTLTLGHLAAVSHPLGVSLLSSAKVAESFKTFCEATTDQSAASPGAPSAPRGQAALHQHGLADGRAAENWAQRMLVAGGSDVPAAPILEVETRRCELQRPGNMTRLRNLVEIGLPSARPSQPGAPVAPYRVGSDDTSQGQPLEVPWELELDAWRHASNEKPTSGPTKDGAPRTCCYPQSELRAAAARTCFRTATCQYTPCRRRRRTQQAPLTCDDLPKRYSYNLRSAKN